MAFDPNSTYTTFVDLDGNIYAWQGGLFYDKYGDVFTVLPKPIRGLSSPMMLPGGSSTIKTVTANYTVAMDDGTILANATGGVINVTLPLAANAFSNGVGKKLTVKKIDASANAVNAVRSGSDTLDGATSVSLGSQWAVAQFQSNGTGWFAISLQ